MMQSTRTESQRHYAEWTHLDSKGHKLYIILKILKIRIEKNLGNLGTRGYTGQLGEREGNV